ncbi:hypothetical protein L484_005843 [Morus notabilis]|uniref:Uncharacterized protein n=1 Tax=Morus notabilis TaxID=981085 RepID=W9QQA5_9ROSA|nr:hypothetical protein L484_005843 [Morus notabilis]
MSSLQMFAIVAVIATELRTHLQERDHDGASTADRFSGQDLLSTAGIRRKPAKSGRIWFETARSEDCR